jgi:tetratricopeptide (TPR) repeat protein
MGAAHASEPAPGLFKDLGSFHRQVTTGSSEAQRYFDQGLTLYYGFNHEEAIRFFEHAASIDPGCAMAHWGISIAAGPNINNPSMDESASRLAYDALQHALTAAEHASRVEQDLIAALSRRYSWPPPEDRRELDQAYAGAMRELWRSHPADLDVGALFAESMMDLRPWDLWAADGKPHPGTDEIIETLDKVLALDRTHVGANHFYVHTMEASPQPERALPAADCLRNLVPGAGHLVHMPSHIDIRLGHYNEAILANLRAIEADLRYVDRTGRGGFYAVYRAHNYHFLAYAAMFEGRRKMATKAARDMVAEIPMDLVRGYPDFLDGFLGVPIHVMVRFGRWRDILKEPKPPSDLLVTTAFWHYGRTIALSALGRRDEATRQRQAFENACAAVPESRLIGNNPARVVLEVARPMAEGELEYRRGHYERAFELLREAVRRDDALRYDEPWGWMQPVRHALGALLLEQGRVEEAESVYREDLRLHPGNGWALHGVAECLRRTQRDHEAKEAKAAFRDAWARADITIRASCYCRKGK